MRLGVDSIGLYGRVQRCKSSNRAGNTALETKAEVVQGQCSILARFEPNKFWGMYQVRFLTVLLERDGNLEGNYWARAHAQTGWVLDCQAITETRELSSPYGPYGGIVEYRPWLSCLIQTMVIMLDSGTDGEELDC
ncbi:hypothetical protein POTOM_038990 [Populus tomentosa]|uniref:Uncharacterized protein n=1 Tax=Populus tomentosa TaxID=118781 RepID=A0A8X8CDX6_POPTO|nr:hypothetical protein POTOM_038990 [Populus tomentosa]